MAILALFVCPTHALTGKVIKVADGDTITVLTSDYQQIRVRLYGIDCPEKRQAYGQAARQFAADQVAGKTVDIEEHGRDRYGRVIGIVGSLNQNLVEGGLAWIYPQYCKLPVCRQWERIEEQARSNKRGLWKDPHIPPWQWRRLPKAARR